MVTKVTKADRVDVIIDEIAQRILLEIESASSTDLSDVHYAKKLRFWTPFLISPQ